MDSLATFIFASYTNPLLFSVLSYEEIYIHIQRKEIEKTIKDGWGEERSEVTEKERTWMVIKYKNWRKNKRWGGGRQMEVQRKQYRHGKIKIKREKKRNEIQKRKRIRNNLWKREKFMYYASREFNAWISYIWTTLIFLLYSQIFLILYKRSAVSIWHLIVIIVILEWSFRFCNDLLELTKPIL